MTLVPSPAHRTPPQTDTRPGTPETHRSAPGPGRSARSNLRQCKYLNNIIEQDHRFIKRRTRPMLGFKRFTTAWRTLRGIEIMHALRKGQRDGWRRATWSGRRS